MWYFRSLAKQAGTRRTPEMSATVLHVPALEPVASLLSRSPANGELGGHIVRFHCGGSEICSLVSFPATCNHPKPWQCEDVFEYKVADSTWRPCLFIKMRPISGHVFRFHCGVSEICRLVSSPALCNPKSWQSERARGGSEMDTDCTRRPCYHVAVPMIQTTKNGGPRIQGHSLYKEASAASLAASYSANSA